MEQRLRPFVERNPESALTVTGNNAVITKPWGDESFSLNVRGTDAELIDALNNVRLVPRLTALLHTDTTELEIIWGFFAADHELRGQAFDLTFKGRTYHCAFKDG